jgi:hypothetical protein
MGCDQLFKRVVHFSDVIQSGIGVDISLVGRGYVIRLGYKVIVKRGGHILYS